MGKICTILKDKQNLDRQRALKTINHILISLGNQLPERFGKLAYKFRKALAAKKDRKRLEQTFEQTLMNYKQYAGELNTEEFVVGNEYPAIQFFLRKAKRAAEQGKSVPPIDFLAIYMSYYMAYSPNYVNFYKKSGYKRTWSVLVTFLEQYIRVQEDAERDAKVAEMGRLEEECKINPSEELTEMLKKRRSELDGAVLTAEAGEADFDVDQLVADMFY